MAVFGAADTRLLGASSRQGVVGVAVGAQAQFVQCIAQHQGVFVAAVLEVVEQPRFAGQAFEEVKVALAILHAVFPFAAFMARVTAKGVVGNAHFAEQHRDDGGQALFLEDAAVAPQLQAAQGRLQSQPVAGLSVAAVAAAKAAYYAV